jgi:hypothetical protein
MSKNVARRLVIKHLRPEDLVELNRPGGAAIIGLTSLEEEFKDDWTLVSHTIGFYDVASSSWAGILTVMFERPY